MAVIYFSKNDRAINVSENEMTLLSGAVLKCYPKQGQADECLAQTEQADKKFFLDKAFFFYQNADRILSDSRMFLAPVPVCSGLAYSGTSGFRSPTLGVYLEWWLFSEAGITKDKQCNDALTYQISGSPLSGSNSCMCVYPDGSVMPISHNPFAPVWHDFMNINNRYAEAKQLYESYSLQKVYDVILS